MKKYVSKLEQPRIRMEENVWHKCHSETLGNFCWTLLPDDQMGRVYFGMNNDKIQHFIILPALPEYD